MAAIAITAADVKAVQVVEAYVGPVGEALAAGQMVRLDATTGTIVKAEGDDAASAEGYGIVIETFGNNARVLRKGLVDVGNALADLAYNAAAYLSDTAGELATTAAESTISEVAARVVSVWGNDSATPDKVLRIDN